MRNRIYVAFCMESFDLHCQQQTLSYCKYILEPIYVENVIEGEMIASTAYDFDTKIRITASHDPRSGLEV